MKRLYTFISFAALSALMASCSLADGTGLDVDEYGTKGSSGKMPGNGIYFDSSAKSMSALVTEQGGTFTLVPRLAHPTDADVTFTLEVVPEMIDEYNQSNGLVGDNEKNALHLLPEDLYSFVGPTREKSKKSITVTIPAGEIRVSVAVAVEPLYADKNPFKTKLALPVRIASTTSAFPILSSPTKVMLKVDRDRKAVTSVMKVNGPFRIKPNVPFKEAWGSWTFQFSEMHDNLTAQNITPGYMSGTISSEFYTRISKDGGIQIKNLHEKENSWTQKPLNVKEWLNISFVYEDQAGGGHVKVYVDDEEQNDLVTSKVFFALNNPDVSWAMGNETWGIAGVKVREIRFWNKALTPEEIKEYNQLPIEDPETVKNLIMYAPLTKEDLKEDGTMTVRKGDWTIDMGKTTFEWLDNVVFPNKTLVQEKPAEIPN